MLTADPDLHLLRRATYGATPELVADIRARGSQAWLDGQLNPGSINDSACDAVVAKFPLVSASLATLNGLAAPSEASNQLVQCAIARQVWSKRQLFEVMVEFWSNHLNVLCPHPATYREKPVEDRSVIRQFALGRYENMLLADARSPAMLAYLMNDESELDDPNENYGRELLQLHTVTPSAGYTEAHVRDSALVLTGRTSDGKGSFVYKPEWHHVGTVRILGWSSANASATGGLATSDSYLRYLARHESTARNIARKLAVRFVSDTPPASLVDALAETYLDTGTAIVPVLRRLFASTEFAESIGQKARRPCEDVVASARAMAMQPPTGSNVQGVIDLVNHANNFGNGPYGAEPPSGYPDVLAGWWSVGSTLGRCNMHRNFTRGFPAGLPRPPLMNLLAGPPMANYGAMIDRLTTTLTQQVFRADHRTALLTYSALSAGGAYDQRTVDKCLPDLCELVLNSPYRTLR
ncbi:MAG: DUF1800 domain-containing protein [Geodermatophilaceae bacterium]|nr:DUF1800 domain-containing protein [Geodermatophilaceae bacterium]